MWESPLALWFRGREWIRLAGTNLLTPAVSCDAAGHGEINPKRFGEAVAEAIARDASQPRR
jgi:hypothetical protein